MRELQFKEIKLDKRDKNFLKYLDWMQKIICTTLGINNNKSKRYCKIMNILNFRFWFCECGY